MCGLHGAFGVAGESFAVFGCDGFGWLVWRCGVDGWFGVVGEGIAVFGWKEFWVGK